MRRKKSGLTKTKMTIIAMTTLEKVNKSYKLQSTRDQLCTRGQKANDGSTLLLETCLVKEMTIRDDGGVPEGRWQSDRKEWGSILK